MNKDLLLLRRSDVASLLTLPNTIGLILLFDGSNGRPLAVMDSIDITTLRTGATTAVAAKYLACPDSSTVTVCGCGNQGHVQLAALMHAIPNIKQVYAWSLSGQTAKAFAPEMSQQLNVPVQSTGDLTTAVSRSDILITCTPAKGIGVRLNMYE